MTDERTIRSGDHMRHIPTGKLVTVGEEYTTNYVWGYWDDASERPRFIAKEALEFIDVPDH